MKKLLLITGIVFLITKVALCQDTIYKKNGDKIKATVTAVTGKEIKYKDFNFSEGPVFSIAKSDVSRIVYESGLTEKFEANSGSNPSSFSKFEQGQADARIYYTGGKGAAAITAVGSFIFWPIGGLVCAAVCTSIPPSINNLGITDPSLIKDPSYFQGYQLEAKKIRNRKVWRAFAITNGVLLVTVAVIVIVYTVALTQ